MQVDGTGLVDEAQQIPSPNCDARPAGIDIELLVVHCISLPPGEFGARHVHRLFTNRLDWSAHPSFEAIRGLRVSAHFWVRRAGQIVQFVGTDQRAWHAGVSCWRGRAQCNDFSIGIELEGLEGETFEPAQYQALNRLVQALSRRHPLRDIAGHEHVAPGRKRDPGLGFDWRRLAALPGFPPALQLPV